MKIDIKITEENERIIQLLFYMKIREAKKENEKLKDIIGSLEHENDVLSQKVQELDSGDHISEENKRLKERLAKSVADNSGVWNQVRALKAKIEEMEKTVLEKNSCVNSLDETILKLQSEINEKNVHLTTLTEANLSLGWKIDHLEHEIEVLREPSKAVKEAMAEINSEADTVAKKISKSNGRPKKYPNEVAE